MTYEFTVYGDPKAQPRPRRSKNGGVYTPNTAKAYKESIVLAIKNDRGWKQITRACKLYVVFGFRRPKSHYTKHGRSKKWVYYHTCKPDGDNAAKSVADAIVSSGLLKDDCLISQWEITKVYDREPSTRIELFEL